MNSKLQGTILAATLAGLFFAPTLRAEEKGKGTPEKAQEAKVCCEIQNSCSGKEGCASKEVLKVKDEKSCNLKKGKVVECKN